MTLPTRPPDTTVEMDEVDDVRASDETPTSSEPTPSIPVQSQPTVTPEPTHSTGTSRMSGILVSLVMILAGMGIGWLVFGTPAETTAPSETIASTVPGEASAPVLSSEEPVAAVADALLPSVVQLETSSGLGSGVIYDSDGLILTAAHVINGEETVRVRLSDGSQYEGQVIGVDESNDIGVIEVDASGLPAAPLDLEGDVEVGQMAVAIGSPFGLDSTVTAGVVSAINQSVPEQGRFRSLLQTDAAINPGNSGGALANRAGEVIGINVSIFSTSGGNDGIGFAVPITIAKQVADAIVSGEPLSTAVLGVSGTDAESGPSGALITGVAAGSGAADAGIEIGDVITAVDGTRVQGIGDLAAQVQSHRPGDEVSVELIRGGETVTVTATLGS